MHGRLRAYTFHAAQREQEPEAILDRRELLPKEI